MSSAGLLRSAIAPSLRLRATLAVAVWALVLVSAAAGQTPGATVTGIMVEQEGAAVDDPVINGLLETPVGAPLNMTQVRETITHLMSLGRFEDVRVIQEPAADGIRLRYVLVPLHPIDRVEFRGRLGVDESDLRRALTERYGTGVAQARPDDLQRLIVQFYRDQGYVRASVMPHVEQTHAPDRASLVFEIAAGPRSTIGSVDLDDVDPAERAAIMTSISVGQPYSAADIQRDLDRQEAALRARGYYEARAVHFVSFDPDGTARVTIMADRGPHVSLAFAGDPLPENEQGRLVPIRAEASVDEDLLEDSSRSIEEYLKTRGYRDAMVSYARDMKDDELTITFTVSRGQRYVTDALSVSGNTAVATEDALKEIALKPGDLFVQQTVENGLRAIRNDYLARGFTRADVGATVSVLPSDTPGGDRHVEVRVTVNEGPRTRVGSIAIEGATALGEAAVRALMMTAPGRAFSEAAVAADRDRIELEYRNRGYESIAITPRVTLVDGDTRADIVMAIMEGPQVFVDHVIILGNERTSVETISRELTLHPGDPVGYAALLESQQNLSALGLFSRIQITQVTHPGEARRDLIVEVQESPPTTFGYGGGLEGGNRLRATGVNGQAEERFELAPRGFFEIGRRNLWGKNRAVNLFSRVSLRSRDIVPVDTGTPGQTSMTTSSYGVNEYRVYATYREPRIFNSPAEVLVTGIIDQAIRSSFNFITKEVRAEAGLRVSSRYSVTGRYSFERTKLFDEKFTEDEKPLIDRLFPQVQISKVSTSLFRDSRDDVLYPTKGTFTVADADLAMRAIGSEVGFFKTFLQAFAYLPLPTARRTVLALGARVGAAHGFTRVVNDTVVQDLIPASERFFAGGDTTVRGFSLDRLGDARTISASGFPTGGNGEIVLNAELRVGLLGTRVEAVGFVDAGNIFPRASDLSLSDLRPAVGFGGRYRSPVGPIRVDIGFNPDRRELVPGTLERPYVLHISLGQAF
jgi:outer membrane protein assembly complex protein YaeT